MKPVLERVGRLSDIEVGKLKADDIVKLVFLRQGSLTPKPEALDWLRKQVRPRILPTVLVRLLQRFGLFCSPPLPRGERMWVIITKRQGNLFEGTLDSEPWFTHGVQLGDTIDFMAEHIFEVWQDH